MSDPGQLWDMSIDALARSLVGTASLGDVRHTTARAAVLNARVLLHIATLQETTTRDLVQATHALVRQTRWLTLATVLVAAVTAVTVAIG
jgi:hypothetical protein